jgi:hypothetical protein
MCASVYPLLSTSQAIFIRFVCGVLPPRVTIVPCQVGLFVLNFLSPVQLGNRARFQIFMAMKILIFVFWVMTLCNLVGACQGKCYRHRSTSRGHWNRGNYVQKETPEKKEREKIKQRKARFDVLTEVTSSCSNITLF